jgi:gluconate 5-dehydrogenase
MQERFDITGKLALVTGSSRGIGFALASGLAEAGARVILHGRDNGTLDAVATQLRDHFSTDIFTAIFDVTDAAAVAQGVSDLEECWGVPDILVNNAGTQRRASILDFGVADWNDIIATNLTSAFLVGQAVARGMKTRGSGKIVNIASVQSKLGRPGIAPYAASKGGIVMLTRGMCADLAASGIQVNALAPGYFATDLTKALVDDQDFSAWLAARTPAGRWGQIDELVGTLIYLASPASNFVNGQVVYVDGGMTAVV